jgi:ribosomal protein L13E
MARDYGTLTGSSVPVPKKRHKKIAAPASAPVQMQVGGRRFFVPGVKRAGLYVQRIT